MREHRIDLLRGLSLLLIFAAHARFGFSDRLQHARGFADAADLFVLLAGVSAALAYGRLAFADGVRAAGRRALVLYETHLLLVALFLSASLLLAPFEPRYEAALELADFWSAPVLRLAEAALLVFLPGNLDILPIYILFLLAAPALFWLRRRSLPLLLLGSAMVWLVSGLARVNLPNFALPEQAWYFDPLSWQFLFVIGIVLGDRLKAGRPMLPFHPLVFAGAALFCLIAAPMSLSVSEGWIAPPFGSLYHLLVSKTNCAPLRIVNVLALLYLAWNIRLVATLADHPICRPLVAAGRHSLPVFALGILLSAAAEGAMMAPQAPSLLSQLAMLVLGCALQLVLALRLERRRLARRRLPAPAIATGGLPSGQSIG
ncbi:hypothetical protein BTR14_21420 [Rhizobium rhizosphaerae]|uniref:Acyltransferase n=1 Tax=Xaviernesmea rhizosphaerae TaxID=1672749 RepID=A0ABX3P8V6_9HYPH|nr:OpgC domain-containing protein [Xaviernesmea rhizosphaerae]OQP83902.1 hypothetical protein BTR14_21420 [Xaviernesmea rhizosphaerae]